MKEISREDLYWTLEVVNCELGYNKVKVGDEKKWLEILSTVLEDKLKQMDIDKNINDIQDIYSLRGTCYDSMQQLADKYDVMKALAEDMYKALKSASSYISQNNPHWSAPYHNETTREIIETISKYEQFKENKK